MKKTFVLILVVIIAALSVMTVCYAAPFNRYYDQNGNKYWCNIDSDGCWVTGENGEHEYIMFWSEASRAKYMGEGSNAPIGINTGKDELPLLPIPTPVPTKIAPINPPTVKCDTYTEQADCEKAGCAWSDDNGCGEKGGDTTDCSAITNETDCAANTACKWDETAGTCAKNEGGTIKDCSKYTDESSCKGASCEWDYAATSCSEKASCSLTPEQCEEIYFWDPAVTSDCKCTGICTWEQDDECKARGEYYRFYYPNCNCECILRETVCWGQGKTFDEANCKCSDNCSYEDQRLCTFLKHGTYDLNTCTCN